MTPSGPKKAARRKAADVPERTPEAQEGLMRELLAKLEGFDDRTLVADQFTTAHDATLTINQAHAIIGPKNITRQSLYLAVARGEFPSIRLGKRILIPRVAFENWLAGGKPSAA